MVVVWDSSFFRTLLGVSAFFAEFVPKFGGNNVKPWWIMSLVNGSGGKWLTATSSWREGGLRRRTRWRKEKSQFHLVALLPHLISGGGARLPFPSILPQCPFSSTPAADLSSLLSESWRKEKWKRNPPPCGLEEVTWQFSLPRPSHCVLKGPSSSLFFRTTPMKNAPHSFFPPSRCRFPRFWSGCGKAILFLPQPSFQAASAGRKWGHIPKNFPSVPAAPR